MGGWDKHADNTSSNSARPNRVRGQDSALGVKRTVAPPREAGMLSATITDEQIRGHPPCNPFS